MWRDRSHADVTAPALRTHGTQPRSTVHAKVFRASGYHTVQGSYPETIQSFVRRQNPCLIIRKQKIVEKEQRRKDQSRSLCCHLYWHTPPMLVIICTEAPVCINNLETQLTGRAAALPSNLETPYTTPTVQPFSDLVTPLTVPTELLVRQ